MSKGKVCTCGRIGEHCPSSGCGSVNKHPLIQRSMFISAQVGADVRFYRCRKCGTEYGFLNGSLFDAECNAPQEIRLSARQLEPEDEVKLIKEAIALLESKGLKVVMADYAPPVTKEVEETSELTIKRADTNEIVKEYSKEDFETLSSLFKKKEPSKDENNP